VKLKEIHDIMCHNLRKFMFGLAKFLERQSLDGIKNKLFSRANIIRNVDSRIEYRCQCNFSAVPLYLRVRAQS
jgi:hypothetical protein